MQQVRYYELCTHRFGDQISVLLSPPYMNELLRYIGNPLPEDASTDIVISGRSLPPNLYVVTGP